MFLLKLFTKKYKLFILSFGNYLLRIRAKKISKLGVTTFRVQKLLWPCNFSELNLVVTYFNLSSPKPELSSLNLSYSNLTKFLTPGQDASPT